MIFNKNLFLFFENDDDNKDNKNNNSRKCIRSYIKLEKRDGNLTTDAEFVLLPQAEELCSNIPYSSQVDELSRRIMKKCIGKITNGYILKQSGHLIEDKIITGHDNFRELKVQPFRLIYRICTKVFKDGTKKKILVALRYFRKTTQKITKQDLKNAIKAFTDWRLSEMSNQDCKLIESNKAKKSLNKNEKLDNIMLPSESETDEIILDMLLKGCYVDEIYKKFGLDTPEE